MKTNAHIENSRRNRQGFTLIELLVAISIIGLLIALVLPAVQNSRESARAMQCKSQMRQFGQALHNFESTYQTLPPGNDFANNARHSWCTRILPFIEQSPLYNDYNWSTKWNNSTVVAGQSNNNVTQMNLAIFRCPSEPNPRVGGIDYGGNFGTSQTGLPVGFSVTDGWEAGALLVINAPVTNPRTTSAGFGEFTDGLSQTFMVFECSGRTTEAGHWGSGTNCLAIETPINDNLEGETIISRHFGGGHASFADGHVVFLSNSTDLTLLGRLATRNRGEVADASF